MLAIEMEDLIAVLQLCVPYFAVIIAAILIGVIVMIACRRLSRSKKFLVRGETALAMILLIAVAVNGICFGPMSTLIGLAMGKDTVTKETNKEAGDVAESIMGEGIVLLENEGLLPLTDTDSLNLFGWESINPAYGGAGSGGINDLYEVISLTKGLENAGFSVNRAGRCPNPRYRNTARSSLIMRRPFPMWQ